MRCGRRALPSAYLKDWCGQPPRPGWVFVYREITNDKLDILKEQMRFSGRNNQCGLNREINQYFAVLTDESVGVMGDERLMTIQLHSTVTTTDFMTADWARIPYDLLERVSARIVNEVAHVNRIVYDITTKPPATIEWE